MVYCLVNWISGVIVFVVVLMFVSIICFVVLSGC